MGKHFLWSEYCWHFTERANLTAGVRSLKDAEGGNSVASRWRGGPTVWSLPATLPAGLAAPSTAQAHPAREVPDRTAHSSRPLSGAQSQPLARRQQSRAVPGVPEHCDRRPGTSNPRRTCASQPLGTLAFLQVLISRSRLFFPAGAVRWLLSA